MRHYILFLFAFIFITTNGFSQDQTIVSYFDPGTKRIIKSSSTVLSSDTSIRNGPTRTYFQNGVISEEINFKNGIPFGKRFKRQENGLFSVIWDNKGEAPYMQLIFRHKQDNTRFDTLYFVSNPREITMEYFVSYQVRLVDSIMKSLVNKKLDKLYLRQLGKLDAIQQARKESGVEGSGLSRQLNYLTYKYITLMEDYPGYTANDESLLKFKNAIEFSYKIKTPEVYEANLKDFAAKISVYQEIDSVEKKYEEGFNLIRTMNELEPLIEKLIVTDSLLKLAEAKAIANYSGNYRFSVIYIKKIKPLLNLKNSNKQESELGKRIQQETTILKSLTKYIEKFRELSALDSLVVLKEKGILDDFNKNYPGFFKSDLSYYSGKADEYDQSDSLQLKIETGNFYLRELNKLKTKYDTLQRYQALIPEKLPLVIDSYKNKQPNIYNNEIISLELQAEEFKKLDVLIPRISKGKEIVNSISYLSVNIDSLNFYDSQIQFYFVKVREEYSKAYSAIYKRDIEPYDVEVTKFKNSITVDQKLGKGRSSLQKLVKLDEQFTTLQQQIITIDQKLIEENKEYKKRFPEIRKNEINDIENSYSEYQKKDLVEERIDLGIRIIGQLVFLSANYNNLVVIDTTIERKMSLLSDNYKTNFRGIYESEMKQVEKQKDEFSEMKTVAQKLAAGKKIDQRLDELSRQYIDLMAQDKKIQEEYTRFESLFADNKKQKVIYKKGKKVYNYYYDLYKNEADARGCLNSGKSLEVMLKKINTYANSEDPNLINELEKFSNPEEIRKAFGI